MIAPPAGGRSATDENNRSRLTRLGLVGISVVLALTVCEVFVRFAIPLRNVGPSFTEFDPTYGQRVKRNLSVTRVASEFTMRFTTNAAGYRQPDIIQPRSRPVLFLGDSYTLGYGVNDGEEFPALVGAALRSRKPPIPVLNAGIGNSGYGWWLTFLRREAPTYDPRLVVLQMTENDFGDSERDGLFTLAGDTLIELPVTKPKSRVLQQVLESVPGLVHLHLVALLRQAVSSISGTAAPAGLPEASVRARLDDLTIRLLRETLEICRQRGWPVLGFIVGMEEPRQALVGDLFEEYGVPLLRMPSRTVRPDLYYVVDEHPNAAGHRVAAEMIVSALTAATVQLSERRRSLRRRLRAA